jgi:hypothetical protein
MRDNADVAYIHASSGDSDAITYVTSAHSHPVEMLITSPCCAGFSDASMHGLSARHNGWRRRSAKARSRGR